MNHYLTFALTIPLVCHDSSAMEKQKSIADENRERQTLLSELLSSLQKKSFQNKLGFFLFASKGFIQIPDETYRLLMQKLDQKPGKIPQSTGIWNPLGLFILDGWMYYWHGHGWISRDGNYFFIPELEITEWKLENERRFAGYLKKYQKFSEILSKTRTSQGAIAKPLFPDLLGVPAEEAKLMFRDLFLLLSSRRP